ncbi:hypothetical protein HBH77_125800 [Parastagonospora nodorum]|nr:hypothetical protein HBH77_125800 [Parastagonospora nodorum]KAH5386175.1 hypothetical protein HBI33_077430 [Parastagonospora nodorum]KAH6128960.1 hypothetical protein HBI69_012970 [Parastagonospora nodorum]
MHETNRYPLTCIDEPDGSTPGEGSGGPVQGVVSDEPHRPQPSQDLLQFFPSLSQYTTWIKWAENRMQTLSRSEPTAEQSHVSTQAEIRNLTAKIKLQDERMAKLRREKSAQVQALLDSRVEKQDWFDEQMATLVTRAQEIKEMEMAAARPKTGPKADQSLLEAVANLGKVTEKARRDMSNLVAGKNRPEQAFTKWETTYCKPSLDILHLAKQIKQDQESHQKQLAEQLANLVRREETTKYLEDFNSRTAASREKSIEKKAREFEEEQEEWRLQRAMNLAGEELKIVEEKWNKLHEQAFKAQIWDEAKKANIAAAEKSLELKHKKNCSEWYKSGRVLGHNEGLKQGRVDTLREFKAQLDAAHASGYGKALESQATENADSIRVSYEDGERLGRETAAAEYEIAIDIAIDTAWQEAYRKGREAATAEHETAIAVATDTAYNDGQRKGRKTAATESKNAIEAAYCKGIHCGVQMPDWRYNTELFEDDGAVDEHHPYWWGRLVALNIDSLGVFSDPTSKWYQADKRGSEKWHWLSVREHRRDGSVVPDYHEGLYDGLFRSDSVRIRRLGWRPKWNASGM